ncbi:MAG: hypothetical protein LBD03_03480 [Methanobrevibacter sp.]|nr:hypothetical protein [Candidatus Methanovirga procula]
MNYNATNSSKTSKTDLDSQTQDEICEKFSDHELSLGFRLSYVLNWLESHSIEYKIGHNPFKKKHERFDIYVPKKSIAIDINPTSADDLTNMFKDKSLRINKYYYFNRTKKANSKDIHLIHLFEKDLNNLDKYLSILLKPTHIHSYQYLIKRGVRVKEFLDENHRQGSGNKTKGYAAIHKKTEEIISCMTFTKTRNKSKGDYELYRLCSKKTTVTHGFARKAFNIFLKDHNYPSVISYCDIAYNKCQIYEKLGFKKIRTSEPNYKWVLGDEWKSREACQKHKLAKLFDNYSYSIAFKDGGMSEKQIMEKEGYVQVYDCGNAVFQYVP